MKTSPELETLSRLHERQTENSRQLREADYQEDFVILMNEGLRIARLIKETSERLLQKAA